MLDTVQHLISNIALATIIATLAWIVGRSGRHSALAHLLWVAVFLKLVTPPIAVLVIPVPADWFPPPVVAFDVSENQSTATQVDVVTGSAATDSGGEIRPVGSLHQATAWNSGRSVMPSWGQWVIGIWLIGFVVAIVRGIRRFLKLKTLIRNEGVQDYEATEFVSQLVRRHHQSSVLNRKSPPVVRIPLRISPMLFGIGRRAVVVCPEQLWQALSDDERHAFLAHETAHFCRRDHWVRWIEWFVSAVYWWFPVLFVARRQLEMHEEACCDAWAVQQLQSSPRSYAEALLKAVEFMSRKQAAIPRLASSMQATDDLERRLRLVMQSSRVRPTGRLQSSLAGFVMIMLVILHPLLEPVSRADVRTVRAGLDTNRNAITDSSIESPNLLNAIERPLPQPPQGFWNRMPQSQWATFSLSLPSASVLADVEQGIRICVSGKPDLHFAREQLTTLVDLPLTERIAVGSADGSLRVWDLEAAEAVSLIGRHSAGVVSMDYRDSFGIVSADNSGTVIRWNLQSGERLAAFHTDAAIQSIRISSSGNQTAVLTGSWKHSDPQTLTILDTITLRPVQSRTVSLPAAIMVPTDSDRWLLVDWAGNVRTSDTERLVARIPKAHVSALVFASSQSDSLHASQRENAKSLPIKTQQVTPPNN